MKRTPQVYKHPNFLKTPYKVKGKVRCFVYEDRAFWLPLVKDAYAHLVYYLKVSYRWVAGTPRTLLSSHIRVNHRPKLPKLFNRAVFYLQKADWKTVIIGFLCFMVGVLLARPASVIVHAEPTGVAPAPQIHTYKPKAQLKALKIAQEKPVAQKAVAPVASVTPPPVAVGESGCGSNPYMAYIYMHESGCTTNAQNPSGAYGLCQSLPGYKMATAGADWATSWATQNKWCISYAYASYGSPYQAMLYWEVHHLW